MKKRSYKIFIADDDQGIIDSTTLILEYDGFTVVSSSKGDLVSTIKKHRPDLVLLDIWLSGMNGGDIAKELKADVATKTIPLIMFSANRDIQKIAEEVQAEGYLVKPFNLPELLATIRKHISN
jgi:DNA-binding response OmpR family regulator